MHFPVKFEHKHVHYVLVIIIIIIIIISVLPKGRSFTASAGT